MRLIYSEYDIDIELSIDKANVLCIENRNVFSECIMELWNQCEAKDGNWFLSDKGKDLQVSKNVTSILNPVGIDLNDRKLLKILYQNMETDVHENKYLKLGEINSSIVSFIDEIVDRQPYAIEFDDNVAVADLLKIYNVRFVEETESLLELIITYVQLWHRVANCKVFVFVNLKTYLDDNQISQLYEMLRYEQVFILLIEANYTGKIDDENVKIIDKDLCFIDC